MPPSDPNSGRAFIWLITCILLLSILAGGGCLVAYLVLPQSQSMPWIPYAGVAMVGLPWAFWLLTFLYRIITRCCLGVRNGGGGAGAANARGNADMKAEAQANNGGMQRTSSNNNGGIQRTSSNGAGLQRTSSVASRESEIPLARSMAS